MRDLLSTNEFLISNDYVQLGNPCERLKIETDGGKWFPDHLNPTVFFKIQAVKFKCCCSSMIPQPLPNLKISIFSKEKLVLVVTTILH